MRCTYQEDVNYRPKMSSEEHFIKELNAEILDGDSAKFLQNIHRKFGPLSEMDMR